MLRFLGGFRKSRYATRPKPKPALQSNVSRSTCRQYLPPEWAAQSGVLLTWPHQHSDWAATLDRVEPVFVAIACEVARREKVLIACYDDTHRDHVAKILRQTGLREDRLLFRIAPSNDTWARDHGPITVTCENEPLLLDFRFNGWGGKYLADLDDAITRRLYQSDTFGETPLESVDMVLEGGSIEVDGSGTLLTTTQCLLAPTRNPELTRSQLEVRLKELLGLNRILWLHHGHLMGDDTDSHIDTLARFCDARTIAYVSCDEPSDPHHAELKAMEKELKAFKAADGKPYRLVPLPLPQAKFNDVGQRLPATYANFLIIDGAVLVPTYGDPADKTALDRIQACFPDRDVVGIECGPLIHQLGSLHCVTMQLPSGVLP